MQSHRRHVPWLLAMLAVGCACARSVVGQSELIEPRLFHLRSGEACEWSSFTTKPEGDAKELHWKSERNADEATLVLRQQDVKQSWRVRVNDTAIGALVADENDLRLYLPVPAGVLRDGANVLCIEAADKRAASDDIRVGGVQLDRRPLRTVLGEALVEVQVVDADTGAPLPARITIVSADGALQPTSATSNDELAVRSGVIYAKAGAATCGLPAGEYTIYAGRGFEYSVASAKVKLAAGNTAKETLKIKREVPTGGYVACDTHIHTLTYSGHGDATIAERMITLAGEGIELPIATDHNVHVDYEAHARRLGVRQHFTPVVGNEYTTPVGHFNIFPIERDARVPNAKLDTWPKLFDEIFATSGVKVAILNHARDLHAGTRPLGPALWNEAIGERIDGAPIRFNAMEVVNSGATQSDSQQLARDWMALLNRGYAVAPIGSSDSHDVSRYIVGQGRTYIRCDDADPAAIDVVKAIDNLVAGRVVVSYGLLVELTVDEKHGPGDFVLGDDEHLDVRIRVLGPSWAGAARWQLYANGCLLREERILPAPDAKPAVKADVKFRIVRPRHDVHLVAIASGSGVAAPYWPMAKPYQPATPVWESLALSVSGAVWIDGDSDARRTSARGYADSLIAEHRDDLPALVKSLASFDAAVAAQAAHGYRLAHSDSWLDNLQSASRDAAPAVQSGFRDYIQAWRVSQLSPP